MSRFAEMEAQAVHPVLVAAYLHDELVRIHPFIDGNGRTSRLLMNLYLLRNGYTLVNLKGSDEAKIGYYKALEQSHVERQPDTVLVVDLDLLHVVLLVEKWLFLGLFAPVGQSCTEPPRLETVGHIECDFVSGV